MARYKAKWIYGQQTTRKGRIKAECESDTLPKFAEALCREYAYYLDDDFSFEIYENEKAILETYGEDLPDWWTQFPGVESAFPVYVFTSNFGEEILCNPSATQIIKQIAGESYGDYDLKISGI